MKHVAGLPTLQVWILNFAVSGTSRVGHPMLHVGFFSLREARY